MARELTDKQRLEAEAALHRGDPLPSGLAFGPRGVRRLSDDELKAAEDRQKAAAKRADELGISLEPEPAPVTLSTPNAPV